MKTKVSRVVRVPVEKGINPFDGARVSCDRWWVVEDEHLLFFRGFAPQCNANQKIAERIRDRLYPGADVRFFKAVFWKDQL